MIDFIRFWLSLRLDRRAVTSLEYGIIAAIVVAVGLVGISGVGGNAAANMTKVKNAIR